MRASNTNLLQIQLTEAEKRHIKSLAAREGLTLRQATLQAFQAWEARLEASAPRARAAMEAPGKLKRGATPRKDQRLAELP